MCVWWVFHSLVFLNKETFLFEGKPANEGDLNGFRNTGMSVPLCFCLISLLVPSVSDQPLPHLLTPFF